MNQPYKYCSNDKATIKPRLKTQVQIVNTPKPIQVAVVMLMAWGDVIISTHILRGIKKTHPDWIITYVTSKFCVDALKNNPDIDHLRVINISTRLEAKKIWRHLISEYQENKQYDHVIVPWAGMFRIRRLIGRRRSSENFMWCAPRILQTLGIEYEPPMMTYLYHTAEEQLAISRFIKSIETTGYRLVMMEIEGFSNQTFWNKDWTNKVIRYLFDKYQKIHIFISRGGETPQYLADLRSEIQTDTQIIHYMNYFTVREMSVLFNYCDMMFSVSSGTANTCMTHECKRNIIWFEVAKKSLSSFPMGIDNKVLHYNNDLEDFLNKVDLRLNNV